MGLFGSLTSSVSGLTAQGETMSVISDNLANVNTVGYKSNRALFSQMVTSSGGGTQYNAGGVGTSVARMQDQQGAMLSTNSATDLAISGNGFFRVASSASIDSDTAFYYTRAGSFVEDSQGYLVNPNGFYLQGWQTDSAGEIIDTQNVQSINLQSVGASARSTTEMALGVNLNSNETNHGFDTSSAISNDYAAILVDPANNADYVADSRFYDGQGGARDVSYAFVKRTDNMWDWIAYTDGSNIEGGTSGTNTEIGSGQMFFDPSGKLKYASNTSLSVDWSGGVEDGSISLDFGDYTGGNIATPDAAGGMEYTDHVLGVSVNNDNLNTGTYTMSIANSGELTISGPGGTETITGIVNSTSTRTVEFPTLGMRVTLGSNFDITDTSYSGTMSVTNQTAVGTGAGNDGMIQLNANYNTLFSSQDGFASGSLSSVAIDGDGYVIGTFTNGETKKLWQVAIAEFPNPSGMETVSGSLLKETDVSGRPLIKEAGVGSTGTVVSGSLEQSTVDIAGEFSSMIVSQRAYQASSKVISTVDSMLNELMQLR